MSVILDDQQCHFLDRTDVEASHPEFTLFLPRFDLCILFASPPELMIFLFTIVAVVLAINDKHTLPVKTCQQEEGR
jgi:hypothetical protein